MLLSLPLLPVPDFWITQLNYIGLYTLRRAGPGAADRRGRPHLLRPGGVRGIGAYTTAFLTVNTGLSPWLALFGGLALTGLAPRSSARSRCACRATTCRWPPSPGAWRCTTSWATWSALGKYDGILGMTAEAVRHRARAAAALFYVLIWLFAVLAAFACINLLDSRPAAPSAR
jgi:branched-chain amino acid transport system permease protein